MATNTVKLNDKWSSKNLIYGCKICLVNSGGGLNNSFAGNGGAAYGAPSQYQNYQVGSRTGSRAQSKGKNKYTLAPIDHQKSLQKVN